MLRGNEPGVGARPIGSGVKRWVVIAHMYLGVVFSLLFVMWFASGIVLAYNPFPSLSPADQLKAAPQVDCTRCTVSEDGARALLADGTRRVTAPARLGMLGARPVWRIVDAGHKWHAVFADHAALAPPIDSVAGAQIAIDAIRRLSPATSPTSRAVFVGTLTEPDQWTLEQPIPSQLPMLMYAVTDESQTHVYVSTAGAEVVTLSTRRQRLMAWLGAIPHWIYPTMLRRHVQAWSTMIIILAALGTLMCVAGLTIGVWQWRFRAVRTRSGNRRPHSPYREFVMRWHHILGLTFGLFTCTWMFSGLMSMNPGEWSPGSSPRASVMTRWMGDSAGVAGLTEAALISKASRALDNPPLIDAELLQSGDDYFRETAEHHLTAPVLRLRFADAASTWLYIEPASGALAASFEARSRTERWLYAGLHDLDFRWLLDHRPLWDIAIVGLSIGGLLSALSGAVIAIRWLRDVGRPATRSRRR